MLDISSSSFSHAFSASRAGRSQFNILLSYALHVNRNSTSHLRQILNAGSQSVGNTPRERRRPRLQASQGTLTYVVKIQVYDYQTPSRRRNRRSRRGRPRFRQTAAAITLAAVSRRRPQSEFYDPTERIIGAYKHIEALSIAILQVSVDLIFLLSGPSQFPMTCNNFSLRRK